MSNFNTNRPVFQNKNQTTVPSGENAPPKHWDFLPQASVASYSFGTASAQTYQMKPNPTGANRKRSSSRDEDSQEWENAPTNFYAAPVKRRRGLTDATTSAVNSPATNSYWGNRS